jgi:hypothetical protein
MRADGTPPLITTSGGLSQSGSGDPYTLHVDATDGSTSNPANWRSGVRRIHIDINGQMVADTGQHSCAATAGSCPLSLDYTLDPSQFSSELDISVTATDELGHTNTKEWPAAIQPDIELVDDAMANDPSGWVAFENQGSGNAHITDVHIIGPDSQHFSLTGLDPDRCTGIDLAPATGDCQLHLSHDTGDYVAAIEFQLAGFPPQIVDIYGQDPMLADVLAYSGYLGESGASVTGDALESSTGAEIGFNRCPFTGSVGHGHHFGSRSIDALGHITCFVPAWVTAHARVEKYSFHTGQWNHAPLNSRDDAYGPPPQSVFSWAPCIDGHYYRERLRFTAQDATDFATTGWFHLPHRDGFDGIIC